MPVSTSVPSPVVQQYERDGYVIFRKVIDAGLIAEAAEHVQWLQERHPELRAEHLDSNLIEMDPFWVRLVGDDRLLDIAAQFIGPNIALFASHYIAKPPFSGQAVLWHQDGGFWPLDPMRVVTLWLAVDHSTPENGCLRVIPGTHKRELQPMQAAVDTDNVLQQEIPVDDVDEDQAVDLVLEPGDVSVHHPHIIHGSKANTSPLRRAGLTIRYIPTSTRIMLEKFGPGLDVFPSAFLLRGEDAAGVNRYKSKPRFIAEQHLAFRGHEDWR